MPADPNTFLSILPNLTVGVAAVLALVYVVMRFLSHIESIHEQYRNERIKREQDFRDLEKHVRCKILDQLDRNTQVLERAVDALSNKRN